MKLQPKHKTEVKLQKAMEDLLLVIAIDAIFPESMSYMKEARKALKASQKYTKTYESNQS